MVTNLDYIAYPLPEDIERLVLGGDLARARRVIDTRIASAKTPDCLRERLEFEKKILDEIPRTYALSEADLLQGLQARYEGFTREEMERLRDEGTLDWVYVEGCVLYKNNALDNVLKTRPELNPRLKDPALLADSDKNAKMLDEMIARMKRDGHAHLRFRVRAELTIDEHAQRPGKRIRVHLPLPLKDGQCTPGEIVTAPAAHIAAEDHPQRTAYFEAVYAPGMVFSAEYAYDIDAPYVDPDPEAVSPEQPHFDTGEVLPQIRFTPYIRALCRELQGGETNPLRIARRFYDYCTVNCCYRFVPPYFTKTNIPEYFGAGQRGDCGMHALLFITLCRIAGIPARWQSGLAVRPGRVGPHDWAMFYIAPKGWMYADCSFGASMARQGEEELRRHYFGNLDTGRMVANRAFEAPFDPPMYGFRSDPYDNQSGECEVDGVGLYGDALDTRKELVDFEDL